MAISVPRCPLRGRDRECAALDRLLDAVRGAESRMLVLRGESGIGKTALLDHLAARASDCQVVRAAGVEAEMELPFAGLQQLCAPFLDRLDRLPPPQSDALRTTFGLAAGPPPDRFLLGLAVLSLLADAAEERPVVCVVDDAQWLDHASAQALSFAARRLGADRVAIVCAVREPAPAGELAGLPELVVEGIADADARALLESGIRGLLDAPVRDRLVADARGNPLALLELPGGLTPAELAGGFGLPYAGSLAGRIERSFLQRCQALPAASRRLLLVAAAEPVGDVPLVWRAAERLGIPAEAAAALETARLAELGARVRFRHPLVRSAVYRAASVDDRQQAHGALAEVTDPEVDPDRRAWHRAHAAAGLDESVAAELERSADRARRRGGAAAAAAFLRRAAELTPDQARRGARALAAAQATFDAAAPDTAMELLASAEMAPLDDLQQARLERLRAQVRYVRTRGRDAPAMLLDAAHRLAPLDARLARETCLEAFRAAIAAGRLGSRDDVRDAARAARTMPQAPRPPQAMDLLVDGLAVRFTDGYAAGVAPLRRALDAFAQLEGDGGADRRWLWLACPVAPEPVAPDLWDDDAWHALSTRAVSLARETGALSVLPVALTSRACVHVHAGELAAAAALIDEAATITDATGATPLAYTSLLLAAWRGREDEALALIAADIRDATARGEGRAVGLAEYAAAVLHNGLAQYHAARDAALRACAYEDLGFYGGALLELVEAASRSGDDETAAAALTTLRERTRAVDTAWARGVEARSAALLSGDADADALYREAIERLGRSRIVVQLARARLVYGEWLRRMGRRRDARDELRSAFETFDRIGAEGFAERARRELIATGETARRRSVETLDVLTPQEAQVARLAAGGQTNVEIGAQLFISPRTVEYHLRKVFAKLGVASRKELRPALPDAEAAAPPRAPAR